MDSSIAIRADGISKLFYITRNKSSYRTLRELIQHALSPHTSKNKLVELWALQDISFTVKRQDRLAIIGMNGAGKSTLLKILSRILVPTSGKVRINGRVSSLLELGTGFHPDLSGRDNIYLNGGILGMSRRDIRALYDDIVAFSEVEKFIDTPIKFYSSGMQARLGFSVAAHMNAEILIIDEVLSVGDFAFQQKCIKRMHEICHDGRTILFVGHGMDTIRKLCNRGILLSHGKIEYTGGVNEVVEKYRHIRKTQVAEQLIWTGDVGTDEFRIRKFNVRDKKHDNKITQHTPLILSIEFETFETLAELVVGVDIINHNDHTVAASYHSLAPSSGSPITAVGVHRMQLEFDFSLFTGGNYTLAFLATMRNGVFLLHREPTLPLFVDDGLEPIDDLSHTTIPAGLTHPKGWRWKREE